ncbi:ROK family protein [Geoalkalibacter halelectricus]|uniref:ROK family protein n=1 Tax=Geoalkalibacter halelectricus TaxID=2847045 RepID=A0ABY5ZHG4_9BACT|nr:ROK family protein [Geoalkalibacter halelectricus]MDO3379599.1 ROK family protein [Geoalkalibacter halelectricus]UWZ78585.1 ROK family protein [Geoalkalibacter halelectricus]
MSRVYDIGIDLGGTNCRLALVDDQGRVSEGARFSSRGFSRGGELITRIAAECRTLMDQVAGDGDRIGAVGAGVPGLVDAQGQVVAAPNLGVLDGVAFAEELQRLLEVPVAVLNDANAIAWGEKIWGAGRDLRSFLTVTLGTGVGGGLVLAERLWVGVDGCAGEFGHVNVEPEGRSCGCGSRGCLEQYSSATGILRSVRTALEQGRPSLLATLSSEALSAAEVGRAARQDDALAREVLQDAGRRLGQALAGVANLLNLDGVVVCGGVAESLDLLMPALREELYRRAFERPARRMKILAGALGDNAGILGAARFGRDPDVVWTA